VRHDEAEALMRRVASRVVHHPHLLLVLVALVTRRLVVACGALRLIQRPFRGSGGRVAPQPPRHGADD
jgi:hypothetical protein